MTTQKYILEIDATQAQVLEQACDLLSRVHMGQLREVAYTLRGRINTEDYLQLLEQISALEPLATGLDRNAYHGIRSPKIFETAKIAYDLHQVIRNRLAWDRNPAGGIGYQFDAPWASAKDCLLAQIRKSEDLSPNIESH